MTETQVNGIWIVEAPKPQGHFAPPCADPLGPKCWRCDARLPSKYNDYPPMRGWVSVAGWDLHWWTCRHEYGFACPEHQTEYCRATGVYPSCSVCGENCEYT